ncbi:MAG: PD-(D/E)XK nuclease family protein [Dehalogenimonas sp.]|uniref:PD-(D/E)XK nuclease family protein n=1 Tax=Candidatus Dehalogenimonas loeffleri TaxID=3127115 RepID=A0ABZ2J9D8_9CHLR|nr:PD-(D/E)XK nuclease family protein [Dehalogenimonas sp.]
MAGEVQCHWSAWFRAHCTEYEKAPSDFKQAAWMVAHNQGLDELCRRQAGITAMFKEEQNQFKVSRKGGLTISGKPDLITLEEGGLTTVYDVKTGAPRHSDLIQVMLYMLLLPYGSPLYRGKSLKGCVVYRNAESSDIPAAAVDTEFQQRVTYFLDLLSAEKPPRRSPSHSECRYCELTSADCPERLADDVPDLPDTELPF